jgi:cysteine desulfuration protein SufE
VALVDKQRALIAKLSIIEDPQERLAAVAVRGKRWPAPTADERTVDRLVRGCASRVWLVSEAREGRCHFRLDADSPVLKGIASLLCEIYDGATPAEIVAMEPTIFATLGLDRMLSPTRLNGLAAIRRTIRDFAAAQEAACH